MSVHYHQGGALLYFLCDLYEETVAHSDDDSVSGAHCQRRPLVDCGDFRYCYGQYARD